MCAKLNSNRVTLKIASKFQTPELDLNFFFSLFSDISLFKWIVFGISLESERNFQVLGKTDSSFFFLFGGGGLQVRDFQWHLISDVYVILGSFNLCFKGYDKYLNIKK